VSKVCYDWRTIQAFSVGIPIKSTQYSTRFHPESWIHNRGRAHWATGLGELIFSKNGIFLGIYWVEWVFVGFCLGRYRIASYSKRGVYIQRSR